MVLSSLSALQMFPEETEHEELFIIPSINDFETLSEDELGQKEGVLILKQRLVMREGEHNGVYYSWDELRSALSTGEGAGLYFDHNDSVSNWVGDVKNLRADDSKKCIFGDIHVVDPVAAKKLRYGAKWGISPTIDAEKLVRDGKKLALDPKFLSFSLVLRPAVRETMLNEESSTPNNRVRREDTRMEDNIEELARKKKKDEEKMSDLESENKELHSRIEKYEAEELERKSTEVLNLGAKFGILSEADLDKLKGLSDNGRIFLSEVIGRVASTLKLDEDDEDDEDDSDNEELKENYIKFRAKFKKKNPKASEADIKKAYAKLEEELAKKKKYPYPYPEKKDMMSEAQSRMKSKLSEIKIKEDNVNTEMLAFMQENQK